MNPFNVVFLCLCLGAIVRLGPDCPGYAIAGIVVLALAISPQFWSWAANIREIAFRGWRIRR